MAEKPEYTSQKIKLPSSLHLYRTNEGTLTITIYDSEKEYGIDYVDTLEDIFKFMSTTKVTSVSELQNKFSHISNIKEIVDKFIEEGIFEVVDDKSCNKKPLNCLLIGLGTAGSHIFRYISLLDMNSIVLADYDRVESSNLYRQDYSDIDVGLYKYEALIRRDNKNKNIHYENARISNIDQILNIAEKYNINIIIDAADYPNSKYVSDIVYQSSQILSIPCILNSGYISNTVTTPIFTFGDLPEPLKDNKEELLVTGEREKAPYHVVAATTSLVAEQIICYMEGKNIPFLNQRGYFSPQKYQFVKEL